MVARCAATQKLQFNNTKNGSDNLNAIGKICEGIPKLIFPNENCTLESPIVEEEVLVVIWSLHLDKAPRPNKFPISLYRAT